jgi:hypothetical protein
MMQHPQEHLGRTIRRDDGDYDDDLSSVASTDLNTNMSKVEKLMADEIERLSLEDRNAIYEEIHGVFTMAKEESPELLDDSLSNFQAELNKIDNMEIGFAYDCIANQDRNLYSRRLVHDPDFRLRFLRSSFFDPSQAALRMLRFFGVLYELYGRENLQNFDGTMDFFSCDRHDQAAFRTGYLQILPFRDRSGRKILVMVMDALELDDRTRVSTMPTHAPFCGASFLLDASVVLRR